MLQNDNESFFQWKILDRKRQIHHLCESAFFLQNTTTLIFIESTSLWQSIPDLSGPPSPTGAAGRAGPVSHPGVGSHTADLFIKKAPADPLLPAGAFFVSVSKNPFLTASFFAIHIILLRQISKSDTTYGVFEKSLNTSDSAKIHKCLSSTNLW